MSFTVRQIDPNGKFCQELRMEALQTVIPQETIERILTEQHAHAPRERKLTMTLVIWVVIVMHLYARVAIGGLLAKIGHGLRLIWPGVPAALPAPSALTYRRYQLGARPLVGLFHAICRPLATPGTRGAFLGGLRLMAIDGSIKDVPDTPENDRAFGRHGTDRGPAAFPQLRLVTLTECGTHAVVDAGCWPCHTSERQGASRLLRSLGPGMLLMVDRGLYSAAMVVQTRRRQAHVLFRIPAGVKFPPIRRLADGSTLVWLEETTPGGKKTGKRRRMRLIEYTLTDPARPGHGERHRLLTSLLDPERFPARELACAYHERWEIEITIDEQDTHQRLLAQPLRSRKPVGVIQEVYGLLLAHYAIRSLMHQAALSVDVDPDRLSFVHALRVVEDAISDLEIVAPEQLPGHWVRLIAEIAAGRLPARRPRSNPRVVKRKMSNFPLKRAQHRHPPRLRGPFRDAVALI
jgi:Insertion element 4 transposase N-terminal/Transposase DDE domain